MARNLAKWRKSVLNLNGHYCVAGIKCSGRLEAHHIIYRSQGGKEHAENGIPLCSEHHAAVHARTLLVDWRWLSKASLDYLADRGWVAWDEQGEPYGRGYKGFAALSSRAR